MDDRLFLRIKIKTLAAEAKIIRAAERKGGKRREELYLHRIGTVRAAARESLIALGFLRGRSLSQIEHYHSRTVANRGEIAKVIARFGRKWDWSMNKADNDAAKEAEAKRFVEWYDEGIRERYAKREAEAA